MTGADSFFVAMAVVDLIALAAMGYIGMQYLGSAKRGQKQLQPALNEAKSLAERGKLLATHAREKGGATAAHVKEVAGKVKQRAETTARIAKELKPVTIETAEALRDGQKELAHHAESAHDWATRLNRLRIAAGAAARAAGEKAPLNGSRRPPVA